MPSWLVDTAVTLCTFFAMEAGAWAAHKYIMHGWGWGWHASHHEGGKRLWEDNDLYAVVFAGVDFALFCIGGMGGLRWVWFVGLGVALYGLMYFIVHDGLVHQRWPFRITPKRGYAKRLVQAHRLHHATHGREGSVSFGFLYAPDVHKLKSQLQAKAASGRTTSPV